MQVKAKKTFDITVTIDLLIFVDIYNGEIHFSLYNEFVALIFVCETLLITRNKL